MKELQKLWGNKTVRYCVIIAVLALLAWLGWKWYQKNKAKETETKTDSGAGTDTANAPVPGKDGTMLPATEFKPQIFVIKPNAAFGMPAATAAAAQGTTVAKRTA